MEEELKKCAQFFLADQIELGNSIAKSQGFSGSKLIGAVQRILAEEILNSMVDVEAGSFLREDGITITLSAFRISKFQFTNRWWNVVDTDLDGIINDDLPKVMVSWDDVQVFIQKLNNQTSRAYRLPTEAEWEYAARGGCKSGGYEYAGSDEIDLVAWYDDNSNGNLHSVGQKKSNELSLYDMSGNVLEWCSDWYGGYSSNSQTNPKGANDGTYRVLRGGGWCWMARYCPTSERNFNAPDDRFNAFGFRLVL